MLTEVVDGLVQIEEEVSLRLSTVFREGPEVRSGEVELDRAPSDLSQLISDVVVIILEGVQFIVLKAQSG